jgi:hypothetical protein
VQAADGYVQEVALTSGDPPLAVVEADFAGEDEEGLGDRPVEVGAGPGDLGPMSTRYSPNSPPVDACVAR